MAELRDHAKAVTVDIGGRAVPIRAVHLGARGGSRRFLLLHGNPSHMDHFVANVDFLRGHGEVALHDAPGFGGSPAPPGPLSLDFLADVAAAYARSLGWRSGVDVIGQSHGGAVAQTVAVRHPELVRSAVLLGTMGCPAHLSMRLAMLPGASALTYGIARRARHFPFDALARLIARMEALASFDPDAIPEGFVERELELVATTPEIQRSSVRANHGNPAWQLQVQAPRLRAPVLAVHGRGDRLVPLAHAQRLFDLIVSNHRENRFEVVEGGHMVHLVRPELVHAHLEAWLARC